MKINLWCKEWNRTIIVSVPVYFSRGLSSCKIVCVITNDNVQSATCFNFTTPCIHEYDYPKSQSMRIIFIFFPNLCYKPSETEGKGRGRLACRRGGAVPVSAHLPTQSWCQIWVRCGAGCGWLFIMSALVGSRWGAKSSVWTRQNVSNSEINKFSRGGRRSLHISNSHVRTYSAPHVAYVSEFIFLVFNHLWRHYVDKRILKINNIRVLHNRDLIIKFICGRNALWS